MLIRGRLPAPAALTRDETLCTAYREGADVHTLTARRLSGRETITRADRQLAKALNCGLLFGKAARPSPRGMHQARGWQA